MLMTFQTTDIRMTLKKTETEFRRYINERLQQQNAIDQLVEGINYLTKLRDPHASLCHIGRLPTELVLQIFLACEGYSKMGRIFGGVCQAWRDIAICTPQLWTSISMRLAESQFDGQISLLPTLCERSGILPLSIALTGRALPPSTFTTLIPCTPRIQNMRLSISQGCLEYLCDHPASLPLLKTCSVSLLGDSDEADLPRPLPLFGSSQQLRHLVVSGFLPEPQYLPAQLLSLDIDCGITPTQCLDVLLRCPILEHFGHVIIDPSPYDHTPNNSGVIALPHLFSLHTTVDGWDADHVNGPFFDHLILPSLAIFCIQFKRRTVWHLSSFNNFLVRSSCPLQSLSMNSAILDSDSFLRCLRGIPSLVDLEMEACSGVAASWVLNPLIFVPGRSNNLVPNLRTFVIKKTPYPMVSAYNEVFADMVESRWWPDGKQHSYEVSRLTRAELSFEDRKSHVDVKVLHRIRKLREEGLDVSVDGVHESSVAVRFPFLIA
jgi:hypothetical protein